MKGLWHNYCPQQLASQMRKALFREGAKRPLLPLVELQRSTPQVEESVNRASFYHAVLTYSHSEAEGQKGARRLVCSFPQVMLKCNKRYTFQIRAK